jgi:hypothetical protein
MLDAKCTSVETLCVLLPDDIGGGVVYVDQKGRPRRGAHERAVEVPGHRTRHATPRHATPRHATPRHATPRHATPCSIQRWHTIHHAARAQCMQHDRRVVHYGELGSGSTVHCGCARPKVVGLGRVLANHLERAKQHSNKRCSAQNTKTPPHDRRQRLLTSAGGTSTTRITEMPSFRCCTSRSSNCIPQCKVRLLMA